MEENKIAVKGKAKKRIARKTGAVTTPEQADELNVISTYGLNLTLDNSLKKYANDPFFVEHARKVDEKFAPKKQKP
jgi:hypothetical protein